MIELPESAVLSEQIAQTFSGRRIVRAQAGFTPHGFAFYAGDPLLYGPMLEGKTLLGAQPLGGIVEIEIEDLKLQLSDGVTPRLAPAGKPLPRKHQLLIQFDDGSSLTCGVRMYGFLHLIPSVQADNGYAAAGREKPSPLSEAFTPDYFEGLRSQAPEHISLKGFLATEQRIPGLGNGCLQDILFEAGLNPRAPLSGLTDPDYERLYQACVTVLREMRGLGGRNVEKDLFGQAGGYAVKLCAKTLNAPCPRCMGALTRQAYMGGNVYFCPHCQPI